MKECIYVFLSMQIQENIFMSIAAHLCEFLVADTQLYKRLCPSIRPSVRPLVRPWTRVKEWENAHFRPCPPVRNWYGPCIRVLL